ncbi:hypothetical protein ACLUEY_10685 [Vreelandella aquamarina]
MRLLNIAVLMGAFLLTSGCQLHQVRGEVGGVEVDAQTERGGGHHGGFCPPGQAKKGNC